MAVNIMDGSDGALSIRGSKITLDFWFNDTPASPKRSVLNPLKSGQASAESYFFMNDKSLHWLF